MRRPTLSMGMFDWGVRYVIILLYVPFLIRLAAVSYRAEKVRTVVCPVVRSLNKLCDTRNCVPKRSRVFDLCPFHHLFILQSPKNNCVYSVKYAAITTVLTMITVTFLVTTRCQRIWVEFLIGRFIMEVTISIRLGHLQWVPKTHCAGRRRLNLLTAIRPVELA